MSDEAKSPDIIEDLRLLEPPGEGVLSPWLIAVIAVVTIAVVALVIWLIQHKRQAQAAAVPAVPPAELARERLAAVQALMEVETQEAFVVELSAILRHYLEGQFQLQAPRVSTEEFLYLAGYSEQLSDEAKRKLGDFLIECDRVKFALAELKLPAMQQLYDTVDGFVEETANRQVEPSLEEVATS